MNTTFTVGGKPVNIKYIKDAIATLGPAEFIRLNPWVGALSDFVKVPQSPKMDMDQWKFRTLLAHASKELGRGLRVQGWSVSDVAQLSIKQKALDKRLRREARDAKVEPKASPQEKEYLNALDRLNNSFAFKKAPQVRHYEKKRKPLLFEKNRKKNIHPGRR